MKIIIISLIFLNISCALMRPTGYHSDSFTGGYWDKPISSNMYQVGYNGNSHTSAADAQRYFLKRCAEVTLQQGFDYFITVNDNQAIFQGNKPSNSGIIKMFKANEAPNNSYNAKELVNSIY